SRVPTTSCTTATTRRCGACTCPRPTGPRSTSNAPCRERCRPTGSPTAPTQWCPSLRPRSPRPTCGSHVAMGPPSRLLGAIDLLRFGFAPDALLNGTLGLDVAISSRPADGPLDLAGHPLAL